MAPSPAAVSNSEAQRASLTPAYKYRWAPRGRGRAGRTQGLWGLSGGAGCECNWELSLQKLEQKLMINGPDSRRTEKDGSRTQYGMGSREDAPGRERGAELETALGQR